LKCGTAPRGTRLGATSNRTLEVLKCMPNLIVARAFGASNRTLEVLKLPYGLTTPLRVP